MASISRWLSTLPRTIYHHIHPQANKIIPVLLHLPRWGKDLFLSFYVFLSVGKCILRHACSIFVWCSHMMSAHVYMYEIQVWISSCGCVCEWAQIVWSSETSVLARGRYLLYLPAGRVLEPDDCFTKCFWLIIWENQRSENEWVGMKIAQWLTNKYLKTISQFKQSLQIKDG